MRLAACSLALLALPAGASFVPAQDPPPAAPRRRSAHQARVTGSASSGATSAAQGTDIATIQPSPRM